MNNKGIVKNLAHQEVSKLDKYNGLPVMASDKHEVYTNILDKLYRELTRITARYSRVVVVRVDLHPATNGGVHPTEINISQFRKSLVRKLEKKYKSKIAFGWVKEMGRMDYNEGWHWHFFFTVKSSPTHRPHTQTRKISEEVIKTWEEKVKGSCARNHMAGWFYIERNQFTRSARKLQQQQIAHGSSKDKHDLLINRERIRERKLNKNRVLGGVIDECFYTLSYMAKVVTKVSNYHPNSKRTFGSSNLSTKDKKAGRQEQIESNLLDINSWLSRPVEPITMSTEGD